MATPSHSARRSWRSFAAMSPVSTRRVHDTKISDVPVTSPSREPNAAASAADRLGHSSTSRSPTRRGSARTARSRHSLIPGAVRRSRRARGFRQPACSRRGRRRPGPGPDGPRGPATGGPTGCIAEHGGERHVSQAALSLVGTPVDRRAALTVGRREAPRRQVIDLQAEDGGEPGHQPRRGDRRRRAVQPHHTARRRIECRTGRPSLVMGRHGVLATACLRGPVEASATAEEAFLQQRTISQTEHIKLAEVGQTDPRRGRACARHSLIARASSRRARVDVLADDSVGSGC